MTFLVEVPAADMGVLNDLTTQHNDFVTITKAQRFDGRPDLVQAVIIATPILMTKLVSSITNVICKQLEARRHIVIEYNGFRLQGVTVKNADKILLEVIKKEHDKIQTKGPTHR